MRKLTVTDILVGFVGGSVDLVGIVGNFLLFLVLLNRPRHKPMYCILQTLSVTNLIILSLNALFQALPTINRVIGAPPLWYNFSYLYGFYFWIGAMVAHFIKVWLTVLLSVILQTNLTYSVCFIWRILNKRLQTQMTTISFL